MSEANIYEDQVHKQEQRTFLRERFLRLLTSQKGAPVQFQLHERTAVQGILGPVDIDFAHVQVTDLKTPMGVVPKAVLRTSDIVCMKILCENKTEQNPPSWKKGIDLNPDILDRFI